MAAENLISIQRISKEEMCQMFNEGNYWQRAKDGEFTKILLKDRHPSRIEADEPVCTMSQLVSYRDGADSEVARVHQYLRQNKTIGASGKPDPKRMFVGGILYRLHRKQKST
jgi:hypothetical protein